MRPETYQTPASVWTDTRVERLKELWNARSHSCTEIAADLGAGITRNAVIGKVTRLGLPTHRDNSAFRVAKPKRKGARQIRKNGTGYVPIEQPDEPAVVELKSLQEVEAQPIPTTFLGIHLLKLEPEHCRYIRTIDGQHLFCGQPKFEYIHSDGTLIKSSYCRDCHARCHTGSFGSRSTFVFGRRAA